MLLQTLLVDPRGALMLFVAIGVTAQRVCHGAIAGVLFAFEARGETGRGHRESVDLLFWAVG